MVFSPSCSGAWTSSARRTVRASSASIRLRAATSTAVRSSSPAADRPNRSSAARPSSADANSPTTPPDSTRTAVRMLVVRSAHRDTNPQLRRLPTASGGPLPAPHGDVRKPPVTSLPDWHARRVTEALDHERCYRAVAGRDARFDGWFFTAVHTTGIYCRPSCPARTPLARNVPFFTTAAGAQSAGFRACRRCRPDAVPGSPEWDVRADVVARAMRLIADGEVERSGVPGLAARLGYSERQLHRLLVGEFGVGALALARAQQAQTARLLIETTDLPLADVAFAAGFASIRQFNDTLREVFATTPTGLRGGRADASGGPPGWLTLRLAARAPYAAEEVLLFLGAHAVPGLEEWDGTTFSRVLDLPPGPAVVRLSPGEGAAVTARLRLGELRDLGAAVAPCRRVP